MIIDFHTHIFPEKIVERVIARLEGLAHSKAHILPTMTNLLASMDEAGIDISVILPVVTSVSQTESINRSSCEINEMWGDRLIAFGGIHPDDENYKKTLDGIAASGMKGIKLHPVYQGVEVDDIRNLRIIEYAEELGLITVIHAGVDIGICGDQSSVKRIRRVIDTVHPKKFVCAHLGGWCEWDEVEALLLCENVYLDTAFSIGRPYLTLDKNAPYPHPDLCDRARLCRMIERHGADKFLFATDSPWSSQHLEVQKIKEMQLPKEIENALFYENAAKLLAL